MKLTIIFAVIVVLIAAALITVAFKQPKKIKEWLLWAVIEAEKDFDAGMGQVKLRQVYDLFVNKYPTVSFFVSFETFSKWVDEALAVMHSLIESNVNLDAYVNGIKTA